MTVEALLTTNCEQAKDTALDSSLAAAQFEAIIRAWKGEVVECAVPASPVGEADFDGSLAGAQLGTGKIPKDMICPTLHCTDGCDTNQETYCRVYGCTLIDEGTCRPV